MFTVFLTPCYLEKACGKTMSTIRQEFEFGMTACTLLVLLLALTAHDVAAGLLTLRKPSITVLLEPFATMSSTFKAKEYGSLYMALGHTLWIEVTADAKRHTSRFHDQVHNLAQHLTANLRLSQSLLAGKLEPKSNCLIFSCAHLTDRSSNGVTITS
jgi:hypothetical protein